MTDVDYAITTMTRRDVDIAVSWAAAEGWNPGHTDAECFFAADPHGFLMGRLGDTPVATISAVRYGAGFGFIGFYIVAPEHRGKGFGLQIWQAAMERLSGRTIGLDGVVAQQENYRKSGFSLAYRNVRYEGAGGRPVPDGGGDLVPLATLPFHVVAGYDRAFFPDDRQAFLDAWIRQPGSTALGIMADGALVGYGMLRPCRTGFKVGPLFADRPAIAERLFQSLQACTEKDAPVFLDVPEINSAAVAMAERHGMSVMFETARMYTGTPPQLPVDRIFGVTSFELG